MRTVFFPVLPLVLLGFLAGCGEVASSAPAAKDVAATERKASEVTVTQRVEEKPSVRPAARSDGMIVIPTVSLPKGWKYLGDGDLIASR